MVYRGHLPGPIYGRPGSQFLQPVTIRAARFYQVRTNIERIWASVPGPRALTQKHTECWLLHDIETCQVDILIQ